MRAHEQTIYGNTQHTTHWKTITFLHTLNDLSLVFKTSPKIQFQGKHKINQQCPVTTVRKVRTTFKQENEQNKTKFRDQASVVPCELSEGVVAF